MKNFLYKVALGVCIAVCVAGVLSGFTALKNGVSEWIDENKSTEVESTVVESLEESEGGEENEKAN